MAALIYGLVLFMVAKSGWQFGGESRDERTSRHASTGMTVHSRAELPLLFRQKEFNTVSLAEAVNHFVTMGEEDAIRELYSLAPTGNATNRDEVYLDERIGWLTRILFSPRDQARLRPPAFGGLSLPWNSMPAENWPLYPVAQSGSTYFVLDEGYMLGGVAEETRSYLDYCRSSGTFRRELVAIPTRDQALQNAACLRQSPNWKAIKWSHEGPGFHYYMDEFAAWGFIQQQAEAVAR
jgi:hypothetical protein